MPLAATWIDPEIIIQSEVSQRERQISYDIDYMCNLKKKGYEQTYLQNRNRLSEKNKIENKLTVTKGERRGRKIN